MAIVSIISGIGASGGLSIPLSITFSGGTAQVDTAYSGALIASGGQIPYTYAISAGSLPDGLSLNTTTGAITGTPTTTGSWTFTGQVTDNVSTVKIVVISLLVVLSVDNVNATVLTASGVDASTLSTSDPNYHARWQDSSSALHIVVDVTATASAYPTTVTIWTNDTQYGTIWHGWFTITTAGQVISIGLQNSNTDLYSPTNADENWTVSVMGGMIDSNVPIPSDAITSSTFAVAQPASPASTAATNAYVDTITYAVTSGGAHDFGWSHAYVTLPLDDPEFWFAYVRLWQFDGQYSMLPEGWLPSAKVLK